MTGVRSVDSISDRYALSSYHPKATAPRPRVPTTVAHDHLLILGAAASEDEVMMLAVPSEL